MIEKKKPKEKELPTCEYCHKPVLMGKDGGQVRLHFAITGLPTRMAIAHNKCLYPYLQKLENDRSRINGRTVFSAGERVQGQ